MIVLPAIDILGGRAVRLHRGEYGASTIYEDSPMDAAARWVEQGAEFLHVVDLDGAREGRPVNLADVAEVSTGVGVPIQVGGGVREISTVDALLEAGVARVVIGTAAIRDPEFLAAAIELAGPDRIVIAIDARSGEVSLQGWTEGSGVTASDAAVDLGDRGARRFLFTAIETDGTMEGPDIEALSAVAESTSHPVIASGGIGTLDDLELLSSRAPGNVEAVIVGKALYEGRFTVAEAVEAVRT